MSPHAVFLAFMGGMPLDAAFPLFVYRRDNGGVQP
jgi:hypothetical protein